LPTINYTVYRGTVDGNETALATLGNVTSYNDTGLPNGSAYFYRVSASNLAGEGPRSGSVNNATLASAPLSPATVTGPGVRSITVSWSAPSPNAAAVLNYTVYRGNTSGSEVLLVKLGNVTSYTDTGLPNGSVRFYTVTATNAGGEGPASSEVSGTTLPASPVGLAVVAGSGPGGLSVSWSPPSDNANAVVTGYAVYRGNTLGSETLLVSLGNVTSYNDTGLPNNATRFYKVSAVNAGGEGAQSSEANGTTFNVPSAPRNLTATAGPGNGQITLSWQPAADQGRLPTTRYGIYHANNATGPYAFLVETGNVTTWTDSDRQPGSQHCYEASAINLAGEGPVGPATCAYAPDVPSPPASIGATRGPERGQIGISWTPPLDTGRVPLTGYRIYHGLQAAGPFALVNESGVLTAWSDTGLQDASYHCYKVSALNVVGEGNASSAACAVAPDLPGAPRNVTASRGPSAGQITLAWNVPADTGGIAILHNRIYRANQTSGPFLQVAEIGNVTSWVDSGLSEGVNRCYQVRASNAVGEGAGSNVTCQRAPSRPGPVQGVAAATGEAVGSVYLHWGSADDGGLSVTGFTVYRTSVPGGSETVRSVGSTTHDWNDTDRVPGVRYYYTVTAINGVGEGARGATVWARAGVLPGGLDRDADGIPEVLEQALCGVQLIRDLFNLLGDDSGYYLGHCASLTDYQPFPHTFPGLRDGDDDWVPDNEEFLLCLVENQTNPGDGICVGGTDWGWPP